MERGEGNYYQLETQLWQVFIINMSLTPDKDTPQVYKWRMGILPNFNKALNELKHVEGVSRSSWLAVTAQ